MPNFRVGHNQENHVILTTPITVTLTFGYIHNMPPILLTGFAKMIRSR